MKFASALCGAVLLAAPVLPAGTVPAGLLNSVTTPKEINADHFISSERNGDVFTLKSPSTELSVDAAGLGITVSRDGGTPFFRVCSRPSARAAAALTAVFR